MEKQLRLGAVLYQNNVATLQKDSVIMEKVKITREEAFAKFQAAKDKKRACLKQQEKSMKEIYKKNVLVKKQK